LFNAGEIDTMYTRYDQGHCDAVVDNRVRLAQRQPQLSDPRGQALIDVTLVIGPRGPLTSSNDANWTHIVDALAGSLIRAEALGVTSANLAKALASVDPDVRQLLGMEGSTGVELGLTKDYAARAIGRVGNYGEIYAQYFDAESGIHLPRGPNALIKDGGLIAAP
jgi:general L-amino acid transport system substrate-binding protein